MPVGAQVAGSLTLESDYRLRGYSITAGRAAGIAALSYDDASGLYLNASAIGAIDEDHDPTLVGIVGNLGYSRRLSPQLSVDAGLLHSEYPHRLGGYGSTRYSEVYVGVLAHNLAAHVYYSPNYFGSGEHALYVELEGSLRTVQDLRLSAHLGRLVYIGQPYGAYRRGDQYDWRLSASRRFGDFNLQLALSGGGPAYDYYDGREHSKTALVGGVSWIF